MTNDIPPWAKPIIDDEKEELKLTFDKPVFLIDCEHTPTQIGRVEVCPKCGLVLSWRTNLRTITKFKKRQRLYSVRFQLGDLIK